MVLTATTKRVGMIPCADGRSSCSSPCARPSGSGPLWSWTPWPRLASCRLTAALTGRRSERSAECQFSPPTSSRHCDADDEFWQSGLVWRPQQQVHTHLERQGEGPRWGGGVGDDLGDDLGDVGSASPTPGGNVTPPHGPKMEKRVGRIDFFNFSQFFFFLKRLSAFITLQPLLHAARGPERRGRCR